MISRNIDLSNHWIYRLIDPLYYWFIDILIYGLIALMETEFIQSTTYGKKKIIEISSYWFIVISTYRLILISNYGKKDLSKYRLMVLSNDWLIKILIEFIDLSIHWPIELPTYWFMNLSFIEISNYQITKLVEWMTKKLTLISSCSKL